MLNIDELGARIIWSFAGGKLFITESTLFGLLAAVAIGLLGIWLGSGLQRVPRGKQLVAEFLVEKVYSYTEKNMGKEHQSYAPYIGTLFAFVFFASALGLFGIRPITADLNVAFALSALTFIMIQANEVRVKGLGGKLKGMCKPYVFMFPLKLLEHLTLPVSLGFRLFGNILGGYIIIELWMHLMEYLSIKVASVPFLRAVTVLPLNIVFDILDAGIQTFIFTILTAINMAEALKINAKEHVLDVHKD